MYPAGTRVRLNEAGRKIRVGDVENAKGWIEGTDGDWRIVQWDFMRKGETWMEHVEYLEAAE